MIERQHDQVAITCDTCPMSTELFDDFDHLVREAKSNGWRFEKVDGEWTHTCPDCKWTSRLDRAKEKFAK